MPERSAQLENGYTRIANELMEQIAKAKFNGSQFRILLTVLRYTYGYNRKSAELSISYIAEHTGLPARHVRKEVDRLIQGKVLIEHKEPTKTSSREMGLNKNYQEWSICTRGADAPEEQLLHRGGEQTLHSGEEQLHPQERKPKKNIKKTIFSIESDEIQLSILLYQKTLNHYPSFQEPDFQKWAKHIDLLIRVNNKSPTEIRAVIIWAKKDPFWQANIMSTKKLREKYDTLNARRLADKARQKGGSELDGVKAW